MEVKTFEIRDAGTFIPVLGIRLGSTCEEDRYLLARAGYGRTAEAQGQYVLVVRLHAKGSAHEASYDPYSWGSARTMMVAHQYIIEHFGELESGAVVDVEFIIGKSEAPKKSERLEGYGS